jgi:hypothetical protein
MAQAKSAKAKPKPKPKYTDKAQSERFIETARKLGVDSSDVLDGAVKTLTRKHI